MSAQDRAVRDRNNREATKEDTTMTSTAQKNKVTPKPRATSKVTTRKGNPATIAGETTLTDIKQAAKNRKPVRKTTAKKVTTTAKVRAPKEDAGVRKAKASAERHATAVDKANLTHKVCTRCGKDKPRSEYQANRTHADNMQTRCKVCMSELRKEATQARVKTA